MEAQLSTSPSHVPTKHTSDAGMDCRPVRPSGSNADVTHTLDLQEAAKLLVYVPYSLHCCFEELSGFLAAIRPRIIEGIVATSVHGASTDMHSEDPNQHFRHLLQM